MATNESFDWRSYDRKVFAAAAVLFPLVVLIGFARTYYLRFAFDAPPIPSLLVHLHGLIMTLWVGFFVAQVWLIRSKNARFHMKIGVIGIVLAALVVLVGFFTAVAAARNGAASAPADIPPLEFLVVPLFDLVVFVPLFAAAIYRRKRPADHKRLMLLIAISFLPPAVGRIPVDVLLSAGPLFFFGLPTILAVVFLVYDTWRNRKMNKAFLAGALFMIASYPIRILISGTETWLAFATWLTS